jgi:hypothetical protein
MKIEETISLSCSGNLRRRVRQATVEIIERDKPGLVADISECSVPRSKGSTFPLVNPTSFARKRLTQPKSESGIGRHFLGRLT